MTAPSAELQGAIYQALIADAGVMALVSGVYDRVQRDANTGNPINSVWGDELGYISLGPENTIYEDYECLRVESIQMQLDIWSRQVGRIHCKNILHEVKRVLRGVEISGEHALILSVPDFGQVLQDPDGLTTHGVIQVQCDIEDNG